MKAKKRRTKGKSKSFEIKNSSRIILVLISVFLFLIMFSDRMGGLGFLVDQSLFYVFGNAKIAFPILLILLAVNSYLNSIETSDTQLIFSAILILVLTCMLTDSISYNAGIVKNRFYFNQDQSLTPINGGFLGAFINSLLIGIFGALGLNIIIITLMAISLVIFFNLDYVKIGNSFIQGFKNFGMFLNSFFKEMKDKKVAKQIEISERTYEKKALEEEYADDRIINFNANGKSQKIKLPSSDLFGVEDEKPEVEEDFSKEKVSKKDLNSIQEEIKKKKLSESADYIFPTIDLLNKNTSSGNINRGEIIKNSRIIEETMKNFGIEAKVEQVNSGPSITCYELVPAPNVKLSRIVGLSDNLAFSLATSGIRIEAPIPGKTAVGIEVPNRVKSFVGLEEMINSKEFKNTKAELPLVLGKDVSGDVIISAIEDMPHLLIAGATGSGKSVCINVIILSLIYKLSPDELKLILIDPKIVELSSYNVLSHMLIPVVTNPKKAASTLAWAVEEMERRYKLFAQNTVKNITEYNEKIKEKEEKLPKIVIIIDELADLMMVASNEIEDYITRLAQMARAAGMHLILATQRPSVDVITGIIKANIPSRISFSVSSQVDSRTILDMSGAEKLLGKGDMLFYPSFYSKPKRIQGAFVTQEEVTNVLQFMEKHSDKEETFNEKVIGEIEKKKEIQELDLDPLVMEALKLLVYDEQASVSYFQRKLKVGYSRAARIMDQLEELGHVGPSEGSKPRKILVTEEEYLKLIGEDIGK